MGEDLVPEPGPLSGSFDQAGDVGDDGLAILPFDRAQDRAGRREGVAAPFRARPAQPPQQRGLARVRQPDQADVGEQLQAQLDPALFTPSALLGEPGRPPGRGREPLVPVPAPPPVRDDGLLPNHNQIDPAPIDGFRLGPGGNGDPPLLPPRPVSVRPFPVPALATAKVLAPPQRSKVPLRCITNQDDVSTVAAISPVRAPTRHMPPAPEAHASIAAGATLDPDFRPIIHQL